MRYLHPVQAHERFFASGSYRFTKNGETLAKAETWTMHLHRDGEKFVRVDVDARRDEGKSILAEALMDSSDRLVRFDIRYENDRFDGGIKTLRATYQLADEGMQIGYNMNGDERRYSEIELPDDALIDIPLLVFRGSAIKAMAARCAGSIPVYVTTFEHAQLFPGVLQNVASPVECLGEDLVSLGTGVITARRYRYRDRAASYWIDQNDVIVKRLNSFKRQEIAVEISNYAPPAN